MELLPDFGSLLSVAKYFTAVGLQSIVFLAAFVILGRFLFKPAIRILNSRKKEIDGAEEKIRRLTDENVLLKEEYCWRMEGAEQLAEDKVDITHLMGRRRAEMILNDVKKETGRDMANVIKSAGRACAAVKPTVEKDTAKYAKEIASKILMG